MIRCRGAHGTEIAGLTLAMEEAFMRAGMYKTIQDYFRQSGLKLHVRPTESSGNFAPKASGDLFTRILDEKRLSVKSGECGLTIQDYMAKPVAAVTRMMTDFPGPGVAPNTSQDSTEKSSNPSPTIPPVAKPQESAPTGAGKERESGANVQKRIEDCIMEAAKRYDLPAELIRAVVQAESGFQVHALSPAGAQGLMQLMPGTAQALGLTDPFDIDQNIDGGARYLRSMMDRFNGNVGLALSAYNAGPGTVAKYNGRVPYAETRNYVDRVLRFARLST